jgi:hypothetical protein
MNKEMTGPWGALDRYHEVRTQASEEARDEASSLIATFGDFWAEKLWEFVEDEIERAKTEVISGDLAGL